MRLPNSWLAGFAAAVLGVAGPAGAQQVPAADPDFPRGRISGYVYADFYYNLTGLPRHAYNSSGADSGRASIDGATSANGTPNVTTKDLNGILIRRVYFQLDNDLSIKFSTRFRLEADSKSLTSDGKIGVALRNAYIQVKSVYPGGNLFFGLIPTPTWETREDFWAYRSIEKTITDFRGLGQSQDVGLGLKGSIDPDKKFQYSAMIGNGLGQKPETNRYKKLYLAIPINQAGMVHIEPYIDYEPGPNGAESITRKVAAGIDIRQGLLGVEVLDRLNHIPGAATTQPFGLSAFARGRTLAKLGWFLRYDRWQANTRLTNRIDSDLYIGGLDWEPYKDVHFMPNIEATQYRSRGTAVAPPHHDFQARVTVYYRFSKP